MLREGLRATPSAVALREALGLALVRLGRKHEALAEFAAAYKAAPGQARGAYVYALALADAGRRPEALRVLGDAARQASNRDVLLALASQGGGYRSNNVGASIDWENSNLLQLVPPLLPPEAIGDLAAPTCASSLM